MRRATLLLGAVAVLGLPCWPGPAFGGGGPRQGEASGATCVEAREKARALATKACDKQGGLAWIEFSVDCDTEEQLMPGVPVSLQVHYLCGADL